MLCLHVAMVTQVSRIINYNVEQECNSFLRHKVYDWESFYQSATIPIPRFPRVDNSVNFIGRLAREILRITDTKYVVIVTWCLVCCYSNTIRVSNMWLLLPWQCRITSYIDPMSAWYDNRTKLEIVNLKIWGQLKVWYGTMIGWWLLVV